jgi:hypothetical protein
MDEVRANIIDLFVSGNCAIRAINISRHRRTKDTLIGEISVGLYSGVMLKCRQDGLPLIPC